MSREQQREAPAPVDEGASEERAKKPHERLPELIAIAQSEQHPEDRRRFCRDVVEALIAMRAPGDEAEEAAVLLAQLDAKALKDLHDDLGRDAHAEAVESLLATGFPHALKVSPEDLKHLRETGTLGAHVLARRQWARNAAGGLAAVSVLPQALGLMMAPHAGFDSPVVWTAAVGAITAGAAAKQLLDKDKTAQPLSGVGAGLVLSSVACLGTVLFGGPIALIAMPLLGIAFWQLVKE